MFVTTKISDWTPVEGFQYDAPEGIRVNSADLQNICKFTGTPATLLAVDKKYRTDTFRAVAQVSTPEVTFYVDENTGQHSVLDSKSEFCSDERFDEIVSLTQEATKTEPKVVEKTVRRVVEFECEPTDSDFFCSDAFKKSVRVSRLPQGGLAFETALLRLACTNGLQVNDSQFKALYRKDNVDATFLNVFADTVKSFNVNDYFTALFSKNGVPTLASVEDYMGMRRTLAQISNEEHAELLFPLDFIKDFYLSQNIDVDKLSANNRHRLPSGLSYYQCFNVLTNGAKAADKTLENEVKVASWCRPSKLTQRKQSSLVFEGAPYLTDAVIKVRMGDAIL